MIEPLTQFAESAPSVPLVDGRSTRYVNFDYAATAPALLNVSRDVTAAMAYYGAVHRGQSYHSRVSTAAYERARALVAEHTGARSDDVVIFTRNTTDSLNLLATAVPGPVLHLEIEHHANMLPWRRGADITVMAADTLEDTIATLESALELHDVALLSITGAGNATGECPPLGVLAEMAHRHGARIAVDGAQLVPHRQVDITASDIDYLVFSGHKLYAPYGAGALIGRRDWLDAAPAYLPGGGCVWDVEIDTVDWKASPDRHEGGTPNLAGAVAIGSAFQTLAGIGFDAIEAHETALYEQLVDGLNGLGAKVLRLWPEHDNVVGVVSFLVPGFRSDLASCYLAAEHGIGVRAGKFCAHPLLRRLGVPDGGAARASIGLGTTEEDVETLIAALDRLLTDGPSWKYVSVDGYYSPDPDPRPSAEDVLGL